MTPMQTVSTGFIHSEYRYEKRAVPDGLGGVVEVKKPPVWLVPRERAQVEVINYPTGTAYVTGAA